MFKSQGSFSKPDVESGPQKTQLHAPSEPHLFSDLSPSNSQRLSPESSASDPNFFSRTNTKTNAKIYAKYYNLFCFP